MVVIYLTGIGSPSFADRKSQKPKEMVGMPSNGIEAKGQLGLAWHISGAGMPLEPSILQINIPILEYSSSKS